MKIKLYKNNIIDYILMQKNIYVNTLLRRKLILKPEYINKKLDENIINLLKSEVGDKCINEGYIKGDTIKIIKRSVPKIITINFSCDLLIEVSYSAEICNPVRGNIVNCQITHINKLGIKAINGPLSIIVGRQYHNNKEIFKNLKVGDKIDVLVIGKRYFLNDKIIEIVGKLTTDKNKIKPLDIKSTENKNIVEEKLEEPEESDVEEEREEKEAILSEEENISDIESNVEADESENEEDMLEKSIEEELSMESDVEDFE